jgi:hypothetical protein
LRRLNRPQDGLEARAVEIAERVLYHQVHPAKLGADLLAEVVSLPLIWQRRYRLGLAVHFAMPIVASALVLGRTDDLKRIRESSIGRYVHQEMTPAMQALRLLGDAIAVVGAWRRWPGLIVLGIVVVIAGWTIGPVDRGRASKSEW